MRLPQFFKIQKGQWHEELLRRIRSIQIRPMHRLPRIDHLRKIDVKWNEDLAEFGEAEAAVVVLIVALEEQIDFILGWHDSE